MKLKKFNLMGSLAYKKGMNRMNMVWQTTGDK